MKTRAYVTVSHYGTVYLYNADGAWIGPGLGDFRSTAAARAWGRANGYTVAREIVRA
jgi:hypothetical protein